MVQFASPTFTGLPDAPVKKVDPYGIINPEVQNAIASKLTAFELGFDKLIENSYDMVKNIGATLKEGRVTISEARDRIKDALSGSRQGITYLAEGLENYILGDMTGQDAGTGYVRQASDMIDGVQAVVKGVKQTFNKDNFKNVQSIVGFIDDLTGNSFIEVFDLGAEAALVKGILTEVTGWGIPEIIDETLGATWNKDTNKYDYKYDDAFRFSVVKRASEDLSPNSDLATIKQLMLHAGPKALIAMNPNYPEQLLEQYLLPTDIVPSRDSYRPDLRTYSEELAMLEEILDALKPDWFQITRMVFREGSTPAYQAELVYNLRFISKASVDAGKLLLTKDRYVAPLLTAPFYDVYSGKQVLKNTYPYIVLN